MRRPLLVLPVLLIASTLAAQAGERRVMVGEEGTTLSIDSATLVHSGPSRFTVNTIIRFAAPVMLPSGDSIDRETDLEEIDCAEMKVRGILAQLFLRDRIVDMAPLVPAWMDVPEARLPAIRASCDFLASSFAAALPIEYSADAVDQEPEPINQDAVLQRLVREYPRLLRPNRVGETEVSLRFRVSAEGRVERGSIQVLSSTEPELEAAVRRAILATRFRPGRVRGQPVAVWISHPMTFSHVVTSEIDVRGSRMGP
jgi:TonB family protein